MIKSIFTVQYLQTKACIQGTELVYVDLKLRKTRARGCRVGTQNHLAEAA